MVVGTRKRMRKKKPMKKKRRGRGRGGTEQDIIDLTGQAVTAGIAIQVIDTLL